MAVCTGGKIISSVKTNIIKSKKSYFDLDILYTQFSFFVFNFAMVIKLFMQSSKVINVLYKIKTGDGRQNAVLFFVELLTENLCSFSTPGSHATLLARL